MRIKPPEISYIKNTYKTKIFCLQKSDQEVELNESFGFRMEIEQDPADIFRHK